MQGSPYKVEGKTRNGQMLTLNPRSSFHTIDSTQNLLLPKARESGRLSQQDSMQPSQGFCSKEAKHECMRIIEQIQEFRSSDCRPGQNAI